MRPTRPDMRTGAITMGTAPTGVDEAVSSMMADAGVPGLSVCVVDKDGVLLARGHGSADRARGSAATASTQYLWFSMTKIVTATAALRLADEGRLDVAAPAADYVDYLAAPRGEQPTVLHLLTHTAGLGNPLPIRWVHPADDPAPDADALLRRLMRRRGIHRYPVNAAARYSNVGYLALGQVISAAVGMPFEAYVEESILRPLRMTSTGFRYAAGSDRATGYVRGPRVMDPLLRRVLPPGIAGPRSGPYLALNPFYVDGPAYGGLVGDVLDAGAFLRMHLRDGELDGERILSAPTARAMRNIDHPGKPFDHGTGWFRRPSDATDTWVEHFGAGAGFWNVMRLYPERGVGIVLMSNSTRTYDFEPLFALLAGTRWS